MRGTACVCCACSAAMFPFLGCMSVLHVLRACATTLSDYASVGVPCSGFFSSFVACCCWRCVTLLCGPASAVTYIASPVLFLLFTAALTALCAAERAVRGALGTRVVGTAFEAL